MINDKELFDKELNELLADPKVQRLQDFPQHRGSNTLKHCTAVARRSFELAEQLGWDIDEVELARCAMLHDYYLYKIKEEGLSAFKHGTSHPAIAIKNAKKDFGLTEKEMSTIRSHMWPLTFRHPPRSKEAALLCLADKDIAIKEFTAPEVRLAGRIVKQLRTKRAKNSSAKGSAKKTGAGKESANNTTTIKDTDTKKSTD